MLKDHLFSTLKAHSLGPDERCSQVLYRIVFVSWRATSHFFKCQEMLKIECARSQKRFQTPKRPSQKVPEKCNFEAPVLRREEELRAQTFRIYSHVLVEHPTKKSARSDKLLFLGPLSPIFGQTVGECTYMSA